MTCHDPHAGPVKFLLKADNVEQLCRKCHDVPLQKFAGMMMMERRKPLHPGDEDDGARESHRDDQKREWPEVALAPALHIVPCHVAGSRHECADQCKDAVIGVGNRVREIVADVAHRQLCRNVRALSAGAAEVLRGREGNAAIETGISHGSRTPLRSLRARSYARV